MAKNRCCAVHALAAVAVLVGGSMLQDCLHCNMYHPYHLLIQPICAVQNQLGRHSPLRLCSRLAASSFAQQQEMPMLKGHSTFLQVLKASALMHALATAVFWGTLGFPLC
jgi:hypothetical protein